MQNLFAKFLNQRSSPCIYF